MSQPIDLVSHYANETLSIRTAHLEGLAKKFLEETGLQASECELVQETKGTTIYWYFRKRAENDDIVINALAQMGAAHQLRYPAPKPGDVVRVWCPDDAYPDLCESLSKAAERLARQSGCFVIVCPESVKIEQLDPEEMRRAGWVRAEEIHWPCQCEPCRLARGESPTSGEQIKVIRKPDGTEWRDWK